MIVKQIVSSLLSVILCAPLMAMEKKISAEIVAEETASINQTADISKEKFEKNSNVEKEIEAYLSELDLKKGLNEGDKYIMVNVQVINAKPSDERFTFSKIVAYEKAYMNAQKDMLMSVYGRIAVEKVMEYFQDDSTGVQEKFLAEVTRQNEVKNQLERVYDKLSTLTEAKLDKALAKEGVEPAKLNGLDVKKKQELFKDAFTKRTIKSFTAKSTQGFFVMKSFYGVDRSGAPAVGIIAAKSPITYAVASDIAHQRAPSIKKESGRKALSLLPEKGDDFLAEMGVRFFFDETGRPALVSYGQAASVSKGDDVTRRSKLLNAAGEKARLQAETQIAEFIGTMMSASEREEKSENDTTYLTNQLNDVTNASEMVEKTAVEIVDKTFKSAKSSARAHMAGMNEIKTWETQGENGQIIVGSVVVWDYNALSAAKKVQSGQTNEYKGSKSSTTTHMSGVKRSKNVVNKDDF